MASKKVREAIRKAVKESGYTHTKFAKKIGVGATMVSQWVSGARNPSLKNLQKIAKVTGVPLNFFLENSGTLGNVSGSNNIIGKNQVNNLEAFEVAQKYIKKLEEEIEILKKKAKTEKDASCLNDANLNHKINN
jgi:transcriptional regulator with XRE-family HTH domain